MIPDLLQAFFPPNPVVESAYKVLRGELAAPQESGYCLTLVRLIIQDAYNLTYDEFYAHRTDPVPRPNLSTPWARDMERSFRAQGMAVPIPVTWGPNGDSRYIDTNDKRLKPGDLLFRSDTATNSAGMDVGHVAVLMPGKLVLENIDPQYRPKSLSRGVTSLTPLGNWPVTTAIRFRP